MTKISVSLLAKILGYAFAGYGLVCDANFLKALFQQAKMEVSRVGLLFTSLRHEDVHALQRL